MASTSFSLVLIETQEIGITAAWRTNEADVMDIKKITIHEFVASTYNAVYNYQGIFPTRAQNVKLMEEIGERERNEMWSYQRYPELAL